MLSNQANPASPVNSMFADDDNYVINGDCVIAQAGNSFAGIASGNTIYPTDCWFFNNSASTAVVTVAQVADHPILGAQGWSNKMTVTTADAAVAAADIIIYNVALEGNQVAQFLRDSTTDFTPFCLSFWMKHNLGGNAVLPVSICSNPIDRCFASSINCPSGAWTYVVMPVISTGFTTGGTWNINPPNANMGLQIRFGVMAGSNFNGAPADQWNANGVSQLFVPGGTNFVGTLGNTLQITDLKIQKGLIGTMFKRKSFQEQLAQCQRYYEQSFPYGTVPAQAAGQVNASFFKQVVGAGAATFVDSIPYRVTKRAIPTLTTFNPVNANIQAYNNSRANDAAGTGGSGANGTDRFLLNYTTSAGSAAGDGYFVNWTANARL